MSPADTEIQIAVVDDDASFGRALSRRLRAEGFVPSLFPSAEAFLAQVELGGFDCLILDVQLGGMSGLELCRVLTQRGCPTPVIFATAHDEDEVREQARRAGAQAWFPKPVPGEALSAAILAAVRKTAG